ncbi:PilZ domain-containing protein [Motilimonas cestriensis]|uniref:PilZ domain-containing protein n=1 Tax=Motilimonas cestriensis TaxID=2742685 RepID=A0ABS8W7K5_9GAMM|nr:PilZ domain-containing protein [Motilimonas cestriensis]
MITPINDRRAFRRMAIESPLQIVFKGQTRQGICLDLSATGMSIEVTDSEFQVDDVIEVHLGNGTATAPPLSGEAKIIRVSAQGNKYILAVELTVLK